MKDKLQLDWAWELNGGYGDIRCNYIVCTYEYLVYIYLNSRFVPIESVFYSHNLSSFATVLG